MNPKISQNKTLVNLHQQQLNLQKQARQLLEKLKLIELLSQYGHVEIVGSLALSVMTWPDIDIEVAVSELDKEFINETTRSIIKNSKSRRTDFTFIDNSDKKIIDYQKEFISGMQYFDDKN